jgi:hypothetical protein
LSIKAKEAIKVALVPTENSICVDSGVHWRADYAGKIRHQARGASADREIGRSESGERGKARTGPAKH